MLVIEGADCMGKTTLAKQLWSHPALQALGMEIQHLSRLPVGHDRSWHYVDRMNINGIFDRFYLSERPYAFARADDVIHFTEAHLNWVHAHAQTFGVFTVLLTGSNATIAGRWDKDEMYDRETVYRANAEFVRLTDFADMHLYQAHSLDYISPAAVEEIVGRYLARRSFVDQLRKNRR